MRFDLSGCGAGLDESAKSLLELGTLAESLGYDGLWINEEHFGQGSRVCLSPILLATALAMRTSTIRIGFSVLVLPLFEPIRLAEEIATLDVLSEGRVDLGVSRGNTSRYFGGIATPEAPSFGILRQLRPRRNLPGPQISLCFHTGWPQTGHPPMGGKLHRLGAESASAGTLFDGGDMRGGPSEENVHEEGNNQESGGFIPPVEPRSAQWLSKRNCRQHATGRKHEA